jgi:hypothetical protein
MLGLLASEEPHCGVRWKEAAVSQPGSPRSGTKRFGIAVTLLTVTQEIIDEILVLGTGCWEVVRGFIQSLHSNTEIHFQPINRPTISRYTAEADSVLPVYISQPLPLRNRESLLLEFTYRRNFASSHMLFMVLIPEENASI